MNPRTFLVMNETNTGFSKLATNFIAPRAKPASKILLFDALPPRGTFGSM
jgi:hypothetical protein